MPLFNNYGDVRTSTSTATDPSFVKGYATANDGGEGLFVYDATSVAPDNDGTVLSHTSGTGRWLRLYDGYVNVQWFGVRPGSASYATNNTLRLTNAINNGGTQFLIPKGVFYINNLLGFGSKNNRSIFADSATIINTNKLSGTMSFENCEDITIEGGIWTREGDYTQNDAYGSTHTFIFGNCAGIRVDRVHIDKSPQAGISMINVFDAVISDCRIQNCWRDGIYAHFAANVTYIGNHLQDIKDDAMSIHEYGITTAGVRSRMEAAGFTVGGHSVVANNTVSNAYTGFASIGCENIVVSNNQIEKTVTAGVAIFNDSYDWPLARVKKISISNNLFDENCGTQMIMGVSYSLSDCDLISRARATIFVGTLLYRGTLCGTHIIPDPNSPGSAARLSNVII
ncbi:MAG: right-handed parallel beta-helix repeat-containing protein, partial [Moraxellaceae bacterium]